MKKLLTLTLAISTLLFLTACGPIERLKNDVTQSVENVKKEAAEVEKKFNDAKKTVNQTVEKVGNLVDAVKAFGEDDKK